MESDAISFAIIIVCIVMSAYFSATETAFSSLNRIRIKNMAEKGSKKAQLVLKLSENYDSLLSTILIGNNIVNIASASLATVLFVKALGNEAGPSVSTAVTTLSLIHILQTGYQLYVAACRAESAGSQYDCPLPDRTSTGCL